MVTRSLTTWLVACFLLSVGHNSQAAPKQDSSLSNFFLSIPSSSSSDNKRDGSNTPNDLFWANRGKKSDPSVEANESDDDGAEASHRFKRDMGVSKLNSMRPNSFMNMYMGVAGKEQRGKRNMLQNLRPNSFLFPSVSPQGKRSAWNRARPNSLLFPVSGKRSLANLKNLRPNNFLFPIPKRDSLGAQTFFAGRGKKWVLEEETEEEKRAGLENSFFAGRGKKDDMPDLESFFAGRGKKSDDVEMIPEELTFFAGRG